MAKKMDFARELAKEVGVTFDDAMYILNCMGKVVYKRCMECKDTKLFEGFFIKAYEEPEKKYNNPTTDGFRIVPPHIKIKPVVSQQFRDVVNGRTKNMYIPDEEDDDEF